MTRDGENYLTLVETHCSATGGQLGGTRANASNVVMYYVNGPMIIGYAMDPHGYIQPNLVHEDVWWRCVGWFGRMNADAYEEPALPFPCPESIKRRPLARTPPHRSGVFVAGQLEVDSDSLKLLGPAAVQLWERDSPMPLTIPDDHQQFVAVLDPPAYNPFETPQESPLVARCRARYAPRPRCSRAPATTTCTGSFDPMRVASADREARRQGSNFRPEERAQWQVHALAFAKGPNTVPVRSARTAAGSREPRVRLAAPRGDRREPRLQDHRPRHHHGRGGDRVRPADAQIRAARGAAHFSHGARPRQKRNQGARPAPPPARLASRAASASQPTPSDPSPPRCRCDSGRPSSTAWCRCASISSASRRSTSKSSDG